MARLVAAPLALILCLGCNLVLGIEPLSNEGGGGASSSTGGGGAAQGGGGAGGGEGGGGAIAGGGGQGGEGGAGGEACSEDEKVLAASGAGSTGGDAMFGVELDSGEVAFVGSVAQASNVFGANVVPGDPFVVRLAMNGTLKFTRSLPGCTNPILAAHGLRTIVAAKCGTDYVVREYDGAGTETLRATFEGAVEINAIAGNNGGGLAIAGAFTGTMLRDAVSYTAPGTAKAAFVTRYGGSGHVWTKIYGVSAPDDTVINAVAYDSSDRVVIAGQQPGGVDFGNGAVTNAGGFVVRLTSANGDHDGSTPIMPGVAPRALVASAANVLVLAGFASSNGGAIGATPLSDDSGVLFNVGTTNAFQAVIPLPGLDRTAPIDVAVAASRATLVASFAGQVDFDGQTFSSAGATDLLVASVDLAGIDDWARAFGGPGDDTAAAVASGTQQAVVAGVYEDSWCFGSTSLTSNGSGDLFLAGVAND